MTAADLWAALPLLLLASGAVVTLLVGAVVRTAAVTTVIGAATALGTAWWLMQGSPVPAVSDMGIATGGLARIFGAFFALSAFAVLSLSDSYNRERGIEGEEYPATLLFTTFGMLALTSATNLMILFLGLEAMSFGFYILVAIDVKRTTSGETGLKYLLPGALSTAFLAFGIALLYCTSGSLALGDAVRLVAAAGSPDPLALVGWGCLLVGIAFKLSLAPAHLWTPDVYQGAPAPVAAFLSGGSKAAAVLLLLMLLPQAGDSALLRIPLWGLAAASLLVGTLAGLLQSRVRRVLAYSSIAQMGYVMVALVSGRAGGYQAAAYYALVYGVISVAAFGAVAVLERSGCGETLDDLRGVGFSHPFASGVLALSLFALAGIPPTAGFTGKLLIFAAALRSGEIVLAVVGILLAAVSVYFYLNVIVSLYFRKRTTYHAPVTTAYPDYIILAVASAAILVLGLWPDMLLAPLSQFLP